MKSKQDYRLRIVSHSYQSAYTTYIVRKGDRVIYIASDEASLALSNLIHRDAANMRFLLEDAATASDAATALRTALKHQWVNNPKLTPTVEVL